MLYSLLAAGLPLLQSLPVPPKVGSPQVDLTTLGVVLAWLASVGVTCYMTYLQARRGMLTISKEEAAAWKGLAEANQKTLTLRDEEIVNLSRRVSDLEARVTELRRENEDVRSLNVGLQRENSDLKHEVQELTARIEGLELELRTHSSVKVVNEQLREDLRKLRLRLDAYELRHPELKDLL